MDSSRTNHIASLKQLSLIYKSTSSNMNPASQLHLGTLLFIATLFVLVHSGPTQLYNDPAFLDAEIRRIRAGKAGDPIQPPVVYKRVKDQVKIHPEPDSSKEGEDSGSEEGTSEYYDSEEIEVTCAPGKGWHWRGQRCVPYHCPGGSSERDFNTGECLHGWVQPTGRFKKPYSSWNNLAHVYATHPAQHSISRGLLALLRRG